LIPIAIGKHSNIEDKYILWISLVTVTGIIACEYLKTEIPLKAIIYPACGACLMLIAKLLMILKKRF
jgi:hypothetical protein